MTTEERARALEVAAGKVATKIANQVPDLCDLYPQELGGYPILYGLAAVFAALCVDFGVDAAEVMSEVGVTMTCTPVATVEVKP